MSRKAASGIDAVLAAGGGRGGDGAYYMSSDGLRLTGAFTLIVLFFFPVIAPQPIFMLAKIHRLAIYNSCLIKYRCVIHCIHEQLWIPGIIVRTGQSQSSGST
jgi:hypothetical protein